MTESRSLRRVSLLAVRELRNPILTTWFPQSARMHLVPTIGMISILKRSTRCLPHAHTSALVMLLTAPAREEDHPRRENRETLNSADPRRADVRKRMIENLRTTSRVKRVEVEELLCPAGEEVEEVGGEVVEEEEKDWVRVEETSELFLFTGIRCLLYLLRLMIEVRNAHSTSVAHLQRILCSLGLAFAHRNTYFDVRINEGTASTLRKRLIVTTTCQTSLKALRPPSSFRL